MALRRQHRKEEFVGMHIKHMHEMIEKLVDCTKDAFEENKTHVGQIPVTDVVDMIKDLNEAEYYAIIAKEMKEAKEEEKDDEKSELREMRKMMSGGRGDRMGYDNWRWRNGRFAPKGRGHRTRMGYVPPMVEMPYWEDDMNEYGPEFMDDVYMRSGYTSGRNGGSSRGNNRGGDYGSRGGESSRMGNDSSRGDYGRSGYEDGRSRSGRGEESSRYGRSYDKYRDRRRHYTENKDDDSKKMMKESISEVFDDMEDIFVDVLKDLDPAERKEYKQRFLAMAQKVQ